jgi:hypothetical protein
MDALIYPAHFTAGIQAFFTRKPLGVDIAAIAEILSIAQQKVYLPMQQHTNKVQILDSAMKKEIADAVISDRKGVAIGVAVADCVPLLLCDKKRLVVGAVHAGWKGTAERILQKTIAAMIDQYGSAPVDLCLSVGPSIKRECYEVDADVKDAVCRATGDGDYYSSKDRKYYLDLPSANRLQALALGIPEENIWISPDCTFCKPENYYSYRYMKAYQGSQGGFICIL